MDRFVHGEHLEAGADPAPRELAAGVVVGGQDRPRVVAGPGAEAWNSGSSPTGGLRSVSGSLLSSSPPVANFVTWWDGDTQREITDHTSNTPTVSEWNGSGLTRLETFSGTSTNNGTKATVALQVDLMGDWREELVYGTSDSSALRIFSTTHPTSEALPTLMDDRQYRLAVAWQNVAYNQPPHPNYYIRRLTRR